MKGLKQPVCIFNMIEYLFEKMQSEKTSSFQYSAPYSRAWPVNAALSLLVALL